MTYLLYGSTIPWKRIGRGFWRNQIGLGPLRFVANLNYQRIWCAFTNYRLSQASHVIPLSMMSYRKLMLGLKANIFLYP